MSMTGSAGRNRKTRVAAAAAAIVIAAGMAVAAEAGLFDKVFGKSPAEAAKEAGVVETAAQVKVPLKVLDSGKALFLETEAEGRKLYFFALRSGDGQYRAALDACDVCFRMNRGYCQEGDLMVCNNCGQTFPSNRIGEVKGGCNPHPLVRKVEGEYLVIDKGEILARKEMFARKRA